PAKLTKAMAIDGAFNRTDLIAGDTLWLEKGNPVSEDAVRCGPRIGISFAEEKDRQAPWRFWIRDNPHVSR
nr:DNA-3-methyladenine glycosylase [Anaerolineae bacterium]